MSKYIIEKEKVDWVRMILFYFVFFFIINILTIIAFPLWWSGEITIENFVNMVGIEIILLNTILFIVIFLCEGVEYKTVREEVELKRVKKK